MTATPTPGDLSARLRGADVLHMRMLSEMARPVPGSPEGVAWLAAEAYREVAHAAIAALSALPAAGGLRCTDPDNCRRCSEDANTPHAGIPRDSSATTPQPSAAVLEDGGPPCSTHPDAPHGFNRNASHTEDRYVCDCEGWKPDAAVGAQGDGDDRALIDAAIKMLRADGFVRSADAIRRLAAPAAGKGVDDTAALAEFTEYFVKNYPGPHTIISDPNWHAPRIFRAAKRALSALTRQPVAGDGMVLVPREPTPWMRVHGRECQAKRDLMEAVCERKWWPYDCGEADDLVAGIYRAMIDAAPAATPTDGGEGA